MMMHAHDTSVVRPSLPMMTIASMVHEGMIRIPMLLHDMKLLLDDKLGRPTHIAAFIIRKMNMLH